MKGQSPTLPQFGHVFIVVEENHGYSEVVGNSSMPYLNGLISQYGSASNYVADTHPSIDNYFMLAVGQFEAGNDDSWNCSTTTGVVSDDSIARELINAGKTWKVYAESIPSTGYTGCDTGTYAKKHNPFVYLNDVANVAVQANSMVDFTGNFANDLANGTLPNYSFVVPNLNDDAHDGSLAQADAWLQANIDPLVNSSLFKQDGLLIIVFDEDGNTGSSGCTGTGNNCGGQVACVIVSPKIVSTAFTSTSSYHHENILRLMAEGLGLTTIPNRAATSANMAEFFSAGGPAVSLSAGSVSFGNQQVGSTSAAQTVTLTNTGGVTLTVTNIAITGTNSGDFAQTNTCGTSVAAGSKCTINVTFTPSASGARAADVTVGDNASNSPQTISLTGSGVSAAATANVSPTSLAFGNQAVGTSSAAQPVTLTNGGSGALSVTGIATSADFSQANNCGNSVSAGSKCSINVTFTPSASAARNGTLTITDNASGSPQTVTLTGVGTGSLITLSPASLNFATQLVGTTSGIQAVTLSNNSSTALGITAIKMTGADPNDFAESNTCGNSVNAGATCTINVTFKPSAGNTRNAALSISCNAPGSPQTVPLSGTGDDFSLSASNSSATIAPVQTAAYSPSVTPEGGFNQTVSLGCSGAPPHASCSISPTSVTVNGSTASKATLTVASDGQSWLLPGLRIGPPQFGKGSPFQQSPLIPWLLALAALAGVTAVGSRRAWVGIGGTLLCVALWAGCGGGGLGSATGGSSGMTPGTYSLTVTATTTSTASTLKHRIKLTLKVD